MGPHVRCTRRINISPFLRGEPVGRRDGLPTSTFLAAAAIMTLQRLAPWPPNGSPVRNGDEMAIPSWWAVPRFVAIRGFELKTGPRTTALTMDHQMAHALDRKKNIHDTPRHALISSHTGIPERLSSPSRINIAYSSIPRTATNRRQLVPETGLLRMNVRALIDTACAGNQDAPRVSWKCSKATVWVQRYVGCSC